jgi:hypothetical protein
MVAKKAGTGVQNKALYKRLRNLGVSVKESARVANASAKTPSKKASARGGAASSYANWKREPAAPTWTMRWQPWPTPPGSSWEDRSSPPGASAPANHGLPSPKPANPNSSAGFRWPSGSGTH